MVPNNHLQQFLTLHETSRMYKCKMIKYISDTNTLFSLNGNGILALIIKRKKFHNTIRILVRQFITQAVEHICKRQTQI